MHKSYIKENGMAFGIILFLIVFSYGLLTPWMGFYWDDWVFVWLAHFFGPFEFIKAFNAFRPLLGPIFTITTILFGDSAFGWQLLGLIVRYGLSLALWWSLRQVWPTQRRNILWVILLFTVFPGYGQQWVALTHVNQEFISFFCLVLSFGVTCWAIRNPGRGYKLTALAVFLQFIGLFTTEYFFGLEIVRFLFLGIIFTEIWGYNKKAIRATMIAWIPYLVVWILNAGWYYTYYHSGSYVSYQVNIFTTSKMNVLDLVNEALNVITVAGFASWTRTLHILSYFDGSRTAVLALLLVLLTTVMLLLFMRNYDTSEKKQRVEDGDLWGKQAILVGLIAMFAGRLPSWAVGLPLKIEFDYDRLMVSIMLGSSLFIVGLFTFILKTGFRKIVLFSLLVGLSAAYQFSLANTYRRDWQNQMTFLWQLSWRIPALEPNTTLLTYQLPLVYASDIQFTAPVNWIYSLSFDSRQLPYLLLDTKSRLKTPALPSFRPDTPTSFIYRTTNFQGNTSQSVVLFKSANGCLRVLDKKYGTRETVPEVSYLLVDAIPLSDLSRIKADAPQPVLDHRLFGDEPAHDWCYYYEKAELARQNEKWEEIVYLYNQASEAGVSTYLPVENLPFIEAYANLGQWDASRQLTYQSLNAQPDLCPALLSLWQRIPDSDKKLSTIADLQGQGCQ